MDYKKQNLCPNIHSNKLSANFSDAQRRRAIKNLPKKLKVLPPPGLSAIKAKKWGKLHRLHLRSTVTIIRDG